MEFTNDSTSAADTSEKRPIGEHIGAEVSPNGPNSRVSALGEAGNTLRPVPLHIVNN